MINADRLREAEIEREIRNRPMTDNDLKLLSKIKWTAGQIIPVRKDSDEEPKISG